MNDVARWSCPSCDHENVDRDTCHACGVARRWLDDPALDVPFPPGRFERRGTWIAIGHASIALVGALAAVRPEWFPWPAAPLPAYLFQVAASTSAAVAAFMQAEFEGLFHVVDARAPREARTLQPFPVTVRLVPYRKVSRARVVIELFENTYDRIKDASGRTTTKRRSERLARHVSDFERGLRGRREVLVEAEFVPPYPTSALRDVQSELLASILEPLRWVVPSLADTARNLREHGGFWVRVTVRVGVLRMQIDRRVVVYFRSDTHVAVG